MMGAVMGNFEAMKYSEYKDSGVEWLGEIPNHWAKIKIKNIANIYNGDSLSENKKAKYESDDESHLAYISSKDIDLDTSVITYQNGLRIPRNEPKYKVAKSNSSLICIEGGSAGRKIAFTDQDVYFVNKLACVSSKNKFNSKFLYFTLKGSLFQTQFKLALSGMIGGVAISSINNFYVLAPPIPEQAAIAAFLDLKTALIDQAIEIKQKQIELLQERKQILIHKAVTRGLNPNVKMKDSGVEWIGEIPEDWKIKKVTHLFDKIGSGTTPTSGDSRYYDGEYNFLQTGDLNDGRIFQTNRTLKEKAFKDFSSLKIYPKGSLVMAMYGATIGKLGILEIESATNQACCVFGKPNNISIIFFFYILLAYRLEIVSLGYGGGQSNISQDLIKSLRFPVPHITEQNQIVNYIEKEINKFHNAISLKEQEIEKLKEYKATLINSAVTGKIKVYNDAE